MPPVPVTTVIAALSAGAAVTVWNAPEVIIAGLIVSVAGPVDAPESASAVTTNCASEPVSCRVLRLTELTPAIVITSPAFKMPVVLLVHPSVIRD